jgi:hypothetical protein
MSGNDDKDNTKNVHEWGEAVSAAESRAEPGDIIIDPDLLTVPEPIVGHDVSSALDEDETEHTIPPGPLWAMKDRRHIQWHLLPAHERHERIRECLDANDYTLYCIDDGPRHAMIGRLVGDSPSGCVYTLLGRITRQRYEELRDEKVPLFNSFDTASELCLCGVAVEENVLSSNVFDVSRYDAIADVPEEHRPGSAFQHFSQDLDIVEN